MSRVMFAVLLACAGLVMLCSAQLNFSPSWGKRGVGGGASLAAMDASCRPNMDALMNLYKLVQMEAQKIVECDKFSN